MKLLLKFSLIFILVAGVGLALAGYLSWGVLQTNARQQVLHQAELMMETAIASRAYTTNQIRAHLKDDAFYPQGVPAYTATTILGMLRTNNPRYRNYTYREATINPTNPRNRAEDWELEKVNVFRNGSEQKHTVANFADCRGLCATADGRAFMVGVRPPIDVDTGETLFLARPIQVDATCLRCHGTVDQAPRAMVNYYKATYGTVGGFGWKAGEVIGALIVSVPVKVPTAMAWDAFVKLMLSLVAVLAVTLVVLDLALVMTVIRPVTRLAGMADEISKGNLDIPELPVKGSDEVSVLASAFNRMRRSLTKAMKMLE